MGPDGRPLAEWWKRLVAAIIDGIILAIPTQILVSVFTPQPSVEDITVDFNSGSVDLGGGFRTALLIAGIVGLAIQAGYYIYMHGTRGQTVGKIAMKLKVISESGQDIDFMIAAKRFAFFAAFSLFQTLNLAWLSGPGAALVGLAGLALLLDGLWPLWDPKRQALHDKFAGTLVSDIG